MKCWFVDVVVGYELLVDGEGNVCGVAVCIYWVVG